MSKFRPTHGEVNRRHELQILAEGFDHQMRFRLDQQQHFQFGREFDARHQLVVKDLRRLFPSLTRRQRSARFGRDARRAEFMGQLQRPLGMLAADRPIMRIGVDPAGMPIRLAADRRRHSS